MLRMLGCQDELKVKLTILDAGLLYETREPHTSSCHRISHT